MRKWTLIFTVLIIIVLLLVAGLVVIELDSGGDESLFLPLFNFCWDQLQPEINDCGNWAIDFDDKYGQQAAGCLGVFDSDSLSLLVCLESVVEG